MNLKELNIERPILFTLMTCTLIYLYLRFENKKINKKIKSKKKKKKIDITPIVVAGIVSFFISFNYLCPETKKNPINESPIKDLDTSNLIGGGNTRSFSENLQFLGKNSINNFSAINSKPDVFLDLADF